MAVSAAVLMTANVAARSAGAQDELACDAEPVVMTTADGVDFVRTPEACFEDLPEWPYEPDHVEIDGLRQAYVDEGPADGEVVLLLHGQPSWSYLYRKMIPVLVDAGYRVIAMDHLGMGRSDKPIDIEAYSYLGHNERLQAFVEALELTDINLFVQDWGSLIGLRTAGLDPDRYATISVGDGALPVIPESIEPFPPVEDPDVLTDLELPFTEIPAQQIPFYDGCEPILGPEEQYFGDRGPIGPVTDLDP
jgi:pimeloyl-ACP methyl ester carboxylesterase